MQWQAPDGRYLPALARHDTIAPMSRPQVMGNDAA
jgi:hypothetical protein